VKLRDALALALIWSTAQPAAAQTIGATPIDALHAALHLSPAQDLAWKVYRAQAAAPARAEQRRRAAAQIFPSLGAPQRMDLVLAEMKAELVDLEQQARALKAFYAALDPGQQREFDARTLPATGSDPSRR